MAPAIQSNHQAAAPQHPFDFTDCINLESIRIPVKMNQSLGIVPCRHICDMTSIMGWMKSSANANKEATCPVCREEFTSIHLLKKEVFVISNDDGQFDCIDEFEKHVDTAQLKKLREILDPNTGREKKTRLKQEFLEAIKGDDNVKKMVERFISKGGELTRDDVKNIMESQENKTFELEDCYEAFMVFMGLAIIIVNLISFAGHVLQVAMHYFQRM